MKKLHKIFYGEKVKQGFTLLELLVALVIFSIGIAGVAKLHMAAISGNTYSMQLTQAMNIAQSQAERLNDINYTITQVTDDNTTNDPLETTDKHPFNTDTPQTINGVTYTPTWTVVPADPARIDPRVLEVSMNVAWNDKGAIRNYTMNFYTGIN